MPLHPQARAHLAEQPPLPPGWRLDAEEVARGRAEEAADRPVPSPGTPEPAAVIDLDAGGVPARLYRPPGTTDAEALPVVLHLHGGGWVFGDLDSHDAVCRELTARSGVAVLAVDYRRAPEDPHPAAVTDAETAARWVQEHGSGRGLDPGRMALLGDSAGGNLAAVLARRARDAGGPAYRAAVLVYPVVGPEEDSDGASWVDYRTGYGLEAVEMAGFWDAYAPDPASRRSPDLSPDRAGSLAGLPPHLVLTAEYDPLRDDGERYAALLAEAGVSATALRCAGAIHGFWSRPAAFDAVSGVALDAVAGFLRRHLAGAR